MKDSIINGNEFTSFSVVHKHQNPAINILYYKTWVGKFFRLKATLSSFVTLKAAVIVNLTISMLYDVVWLWTAVMRSTCGYKITHDILTHGNQEQLKSTGQSWPLLSAGSLA